MQKRKLGKSDLEVTALGLGCAGRACGKSRAWDLPCSQAWNTRFHKKRGMIGAPARSATVKIVPRAFKS